MATSPAPSFLPLFVRLSLVNILSNLMVPLAGLIDVSFLGHLTDIRHLAGVALATIIFNYVYWTFGFLRMSTTGMTAQAVGRGEPDTVLLIGLRHGILAVAIGLLILLLQSPLRWVGFTLLSAAPDVRAAGQEYYDALIWGAPVNLLGFVLIGWFLGRSQSSKVLLLSLIASSSNVLLNYWLIVRWGWGSAGAGWATAASQYLMGFVGLGLVAWEVRWPQVQAVAPKLYDPLTLRAAFSLNRDILIRTFALVTTFSVFTNLSSILGTVVLSANTIMLQVITFAAYFIDGLAFATESLAGLFQGQRATHQLTRLVQVSGGASLGLGLLFATTTILLPTSLFGLLTHHAAILDRLTQDVVWLLPILGFGSIAYMLDGYFLGLTRGQILRRSSLIASLVGFAPMAILAWQARSTQLLWLALSLFMLARALTLGLQVPRSLENRE
ncbi:guanitoxin biosynthesis MATE family efflux transporter GntT [Egbenema bharatensis]|uniref:guanitoxin biosynthesis MATE family efflux transporter GntT n=1 Tax=Egbenema bharatensis TaxID=3463334 RepID=UPI003A8BAF2E